ncbi:hypothetical protein [Actinoplanes couchii]|uniref:Uncharacterized protein n=1 Tax=Actinoplanes couchii TaxID=403638 RepID=A0ABQ3X3H1_9ACTN|nr:hypothetical protein [Actinoplanes couchii]MDR6322821.1 hypothetical protein [Actinoplanes couchii]GID53061.1 hypothetical protein Aco03nite_014650 [Actinoplanes couchii]
MTSPEEWTPMDRKTADSLLRGDRTGHALDRVLAAAQAPATAAELAGEADAMAAFRAAAQAPAKHRKRPSVIQSCLTRMLTLKVAAVAFATSATVGGMALAANTGALHEATFSAPEPSATATSEAAQVSPPVSPTVSPPAQVGTTSSATPKKRVTDTDLCTDFQRNHERFREQVRRAGKNQVEMERTCRTRAGAPNTSPSARQPSREPFRDRNGGGTRTPEREPQQGGGNTGGAGQPHR